MGVLHVLSFMELNGLCKNMDIRRLSVTDSRSVIVVDGNMFIQSYLFETFPWMVGGVADFSEDIRNFVKKFRRLNLKLVFFFREYYVSEGRTPGFWNVCRKKNVQCANRIFNMLKMERVMHFDSVDNRGQNLYDLHCWTISVLQEMKCEVICPYKDLTWHIASYARENNCLAILSQNANFVFFENLPSYFLSLGHLHLQSMTTKAYFRNLLVKKLKLDKKYFPLLATLLGNAKDFNYIDRDRVKKIVRKRVVSCPASSVCHVTAAYITEKCNSLKYLDIRMKFKQDFPEDSEKLSKLYTENEVKFGVHIQYARDISHDMTTNIWDKIVLKSQELTRSGIMCGRINFIVQKQIFEQYFGLEDFEEFPPFSLVYKSLRKKMYGILLHEAIDFLENVEVKEWCVEGEEMPNCPVLVEPIPVESSLHPGLLKLWDTSIKDQSHIEDKWRLFSNAISPNLDYQSLLDLPKFFVIPVSILYYLFYTLQKFSRGDSYSILHPWEIDVFLAVAITLPSVDKQKVKDMYIHRGNSRAIRLIGLFLQGCDLMKMLIQSCGLFLEKKYSSVCFYFDGKLFQYYYQIAESGAPLLETGQEELRQLQLARSIIFH